MVYSHQYATLLDSQMEIGLEQSRGDVLYLSHAHSDHLRSPRKKKGVIVSKESYELANWKEKYDPIIINPKGIKLLNAGHILGSTQLMADTNEGRLIYTGDFKLRDGLTTKKAEVKECDTLIIESTYAQPGISFPEYESVYYEIYNWVRKNKQSILLFGGYSLGKSQEIIKILNTYCNITPIVDKKVDQYCRIYEKYGIKLDRLLIGTNEANEVMRDSFVAVMPQRIVNRRFAYKLSFAYNREVLCAVASGQILMRPMSVDKGFLLSDHADFNDILTYIEQAKPKQIFCAHGNEYLLSNELRKRGHNAKPYSYLDSSQRLLSTL
ncbi:MBL fold metallo-hydrolase [Candidatus Micrarchaeota archaeon]|nr:MBL fold metallo-hydrolase [Candidatus Micrarchaeota archaeon]